MWQKCEVFHDFFPPVSREEFLYCQIMRRKLLKYEVYFSCLVNNLIFVLSIVEEIRRNILKLVAKSYSSLETEKLCKYLGCDPQKIQSIVEDNGWSIDGTFVFPKPIEEEFHDNRIQFNAFEKLTDSISFLEN